MSPTILMQSPEPLDHQVLQGAALPSGHTYVINSENQINARAEDVPTLIGRGWVALTLPTAKIITGSEYTLVLADLNRKLSFTADDPVVLTVPDNLVSSLLDAEVRILQIGAGPITPYGSDIRNNLLLTESAGQNSIMVLTKIPGTANGWILSGEIA